MSSTAASTHTSAASFLARRPERGVDAMPDAPGYHDHRDVAATPDPGEQAAVSP
jgi:hypothetical protein